MFLFTMRCCIFLIILLVGVYSKTEALSMSSCLKEQDAEFCKACLDMVTTKAPTTTTITTTTPVATTAKITQAAVPRTTVSPVNNGCGAGWTFFNRPSGGWCIRVFTGNHNAKVDAEGACAAVGATLTGLQNKADALFIQNALLSQIPQRSASVWIGIQRTKACVNKPITVNCTITNSFEWTDNSTTGTDGFLFTHEQPDNHYIMQSCAILLASKDPEIVLNGTYRAATLDDVNCVTPFPIPVVSRKIRGYACGKRNICEPGWRFFDRPSGGWCMKVFNEFHAAKADAERACQDVGATLSGFQTPEEAVYIQSSYLGQVSQDIGSIWVGVQRKADCMNQTMAADCSKNTAFEWTDNSATGTAGLVFRGGKTIITSSDQNCAKLLFLRAPIVSTAPLDLVNCVGNFAPSLEDRKTFGFVCGKRA